MLDKYLSHIPVTADADFVSISSQKLTFNSTVMRVPLTLKIITDHVVEDTETLLACLILEGSSHRSVIELNPNSTDITIIDSHSKQQALFKTKFTCHIYLNVLTLYDTLSINYARFIV